MTDEDCLRDILPMVDLSQLKFKERDFMEGIFKFWADDKNKETFQVYQNLISLGDAVYAYYTS